MPSCAAVLPERRLRMSADYIALVRRGPRSVSQTGLRDALAQAPTGQGAATLFFQGDGCETAHALVAGASALARSGRFDLCVCSTSWKRRYGQVPPPSPLRAESLVFFYQRLARARRVDSFGLGGCCCCPVPVVGRDAVPLLIEIAAAPADERQHRETLEVALGAAALELVGGVLLHGRGREHLAGERARGWRQITDFELLEVASLDAGGRPAPDAGAVAVDAGRARQMRAAATILLL